MLKIADSTSLVRARNAGRARHCREEGLLGPYDTALSVMTDFEKEFPHTIAAGQSTEEAQASMSRSGEYALLVVRAGPDAEDPQVVGLITLFDIYRLEKQRCELPAVERIDNPRVEAVMTAWIQLPRVTYDSLRLLTVLDLFDMFQWTERTHLLVIDGDDSCEHAIVRGLIARGTVAKRLERGALLL